MIDDKLKTADGRMDKAIDFLREELKSLRTGRATTALVDGIEIEQYGQKMQLRQVATISAPDARTIAITPWDRSAIAPIEKAIRETQSLGLNPSNDGATIRLAVPPMTEERRREVVKGLGEKVESCRIALRNIRHEILTDIKKLEKDKQIALDDVKYAENELNKKIERYHKQIEEIQQQKTAEIMEV